MEVNKGEAERCRDMGAEALRRGQNSRAAKLLKKSLQLYPLPGVKALLGQAERRLEAEQQGSGGAGTGAGDENSSRAANGSGQGFATGGNAGEARRPAGAAPPLSSRTFARSASTASSTASGAAGTGACGREYTEEQERIVKQVLHAKEGGRGAHYRVLGVEQDANESTLKKSYRKMALKLHPDKNSAPNADEAFKAVGLAYATLSDSQKRAVYDRYGDEDPDNRGSTGPGGMRHGNMHFNGQEVSPEDLFNMFFGGMPGGGGARGFGGPGVRMYSSGFGPGSAAGGMPRRRGGQRQEEPEQPGFMQFAQFLPIIMLFLLSFLNFPGDGSSSTGSNPYFSLAHSPPFVNPLKTELTQVKEIPYFVTDKFMRTYYRDRFQRAQVERMVEKSYEKYLTAECKNQEIYKRQLERNARDRKGLTPENRERQLKKAAEFELTRCSELHGLFPNSHRGGGWGR